MNITILNGRIPIVYVFIDNDDRIISVNGSCYLTQKKDTKVEQLFDAPQWDADRGS